MAQSKSAGSFNWLYLFIGIAILINFSGLFITIIGPDGTLYATIAKTMVLKHDYIDMYAQGKDWLDKPHFPFWITALFFNAFGFTTWAYKLPAILFMMMGARYTYLLAKNLYNKEIALWAVLILLTAQHIVLSNNDVRAEPYLTGLIIAAVYHFYKAHTKNNHWHLVAACLFTACAIMTKGLFALVPIGGAIGGHLIITRQWQQVFNWRWLLSAILIFIFILPEIFCLYSQFDAHPEKLVFGQHGVSGIKFFFWDSQFGRFFNTGPIKGSGDPFFFVHTTLWAFLPWSVMLFIAIFQFIKTKSKNVKQHEWYCICAGLLTFLLFSASRFQLPHYLNIVFPFFAIITAQYLRSLVAAPSRIVPIIQVVVIIILMLAINVLHYFFDPGDIFTSVMLIVSSLCLLWIILLPGNMRAKLGYHAAVASFIINIYLNVAFYPALLRYQGGSEAANWINEHNTGKLPVALSGEIPYATEFYLNQPLNLLNEDGSGTIPAKPFLLYTSDRVIRQLQQKGWHIAPVHQLDSYWISRLTPNFLNKRTRNQALTPMQVALVK